ncbi:MAG: VWA domain-containing protein [Phycisphaerae bacterium]|nr:VWA domain-containing protein [Phycisphaerae bacterium]
MIALIAAFIIALALCLAAWLRMHGLDGAGGTISGLTPGSGGGSGTGTSGDGPGAGASGEGRGRDGTGAGLPRGAPEGGAADRSPDTVTDVVAAAAVEPPRIGFTVPDEPPPVVKPPVTPPPSGTVDGDGSPGRSGSGGGGTGTEFMGVRTTATRIVYVIDQSGSMADTKFAHTKLELRRSIEKLPDRGAFWVIFFNSSATPMPPGALVTATKKNKADGIDWIRNQTVGGGTDPTQAMELALQEPRPDAIFLMTDGQFQPEPVFEVINRKNADRKVSISTICFHSRDAEEPLKRIAAENRGDYTYVPPPTKP